MPLAPGTRIGPYEIAAPIGAGGMGEVYRATDTNLRRQVALKVLPASLASDPERLARFRREAEVLAALNHPNIAQIHGIEIARVDAGPEVTAGAIHALVMELVEGETLAERIARGPVPLDDAVPLARQIADALAAAHERGIVHRDLKPANVKVRPDGTLKVLDFGLAKASAPAEASVVGTSLTPTITTPAMVTVSGVILGTAAYMSPEQARGKPVDKSADVWAFGVVLWEMLTGRRLFAGDTVSDTIAAVLRQEPAWEDIPERLRPVLRLCLQKEPRHRLRDIGDARILLDEAVAGRAALPVAEAARDSQPLWRRALPLAAAALVTAVVVGGTAWTWRRPALGALTHLAVIHPPPEMIGGNDFDDNIAIAPDGRSIAYVAAEPSASSNTLRLYLRALDRPTPVLLTATARAPFFSPDGQWVGFVENNQRLSKVPVAGGPVVPIGGRVNAPRGVSWGDDDTIVYATADLASGLMRIAASGGEAQALTTVDRAKGELDHVFPQVLPAARGVLFAVTTVADGSQVAVYDSRRGEHRVLLATGAHPRYVPPGFIVYTVAGSLHAVAFDLDRLEVVGMPVPVVEGIQTRPSGAAGFAVAPDGTLAYLEGAAGQQQRSFVWIDRQGRETPVPLDPGDFDTFALSPDGGSVAVTRRGTAGTDASIWVWSHERQTLSRLTFEPGVHEMPLWAPDGRSIVYTTCRSGCALHIRRADGTGVPEPLQRMDDASERTQVTATGWTRDGRVLFEELRHGGNWDVKSVAVTGTREESVLLSEAAYREGAATVSPDGRWIAYVSNESGFPQVYVRTFPNLDGGKWQVSADFATTPRWSPDGRTLYFLDNPQQGGSRGVAAVTVPAGDTFSVSKPERLFDLPASVRGVALVRNFGNEFEVSPDGQQFLFMKDGARAAPGALHVVLNWTTELARLARAR